MKLKIEVNDNEELSGYVDDEYFVIYKTPIWGINFGLTELALIAACDRITTLDSQLAEAAELIETMHDEMGMLSPSTVYCRRTAAEFLKKIEEHNIEKY